MKHALLLLFAASLAAQTAPVSPFAAGVSGGYMIRKNVVYSQASGVDNKLDVFFHRNDTSRHPVVIYIHGGGWTGGSKDGSVLALVPYLEAGWDVVNVEYRLARFAPAPAAVEDCRCALWWVFLHADEFHFDTSRVVVTGDSAGGHLALTTGMLRDGIFDRQCDDPDVLPAKVAAIVNWYGVTDVNDLLDGPNRRPFAVQWLGLEPNRERIARAVSPMQLLRKDLPPIITVHGDKDPTVPYEHAVRLHKALDGLGVPNQLVRIPGGGHAGFSTPEMVRAYNEVFRFLDRHVMKR